MILPTGATSVSTDVGIYDDTGLPVTGLVAATFPAVTWSLAGAHADNSLALSDLALLTTAWASGGVKERGNGVYRLDLPDAAFATAGEVKVRGEASGKHLVTPAVDVGVVPANFGATSISVGGVVQSDLQKIGGNLVLLNGTTGCLVVSLGDWLGTVPQPLQDQLVQVNVEEWKDAVAPAMTGDAFARIGAAGVGLTAVALSTAGNNAVADALLDRADAVETGLTPRGCFRLMVAADAGKLSGAATTAVVIRNAVADTKARITATVDSNGNRTAITWDAT